MGWGACGRRGVPTWWKLLFEGCIYSGIVEVMKWKQSSSVEICGIYLKCRIPSWNRPSRRLIYTKYHHSHQFRPQVSIDKSTYYSGPQPCLTTSNRYSRNILIDHWSITMRYTYFQRQVWGTRGKLTVLSISRSRGRSDTVRWRFPSNLLSAVSFSSWHYEIHGWVSYSRVLLIFTCEIVSFYRKDAAFCCLRKMSVIRPPGRVLLNTYHVKHVNGVCKAKIDYLVLFYGFYHV